MSIGAGQPDIWDHAQDLMGRAYRIGILSCAIAISGGIAFACVAGFLAIVFHVVAAAVVLLIRWN